MAETDTATTATVARPTVQAFLTTISHFTQPSSSGAGRGERKSELERTATKAVEVTTQGPDTIVHVTHYPEGRVYIGVHRRGRCIAHVSIAPENEQLREGWEVEYEHFKTVETRVAK